MTEKDDAIFNWMKRALEMQARMMANFRPLIIHRCPEDCPMLRHGRCIASKCILLNPLAPEPVKIGQNP